MAIEFKNTNNFREYPFREFSASSPIGAATFLAEAVVDAQFDIFCDRLRDGTDNAPLVVIKRLAFTPGTGENYEIEIDVTVGFGLRSTTTDQPVFDTPTPRKWFTLSTIKLTNASATDDKYTYLWVSESGEDFDFEDDISTPTAKYRGTHVYATGYIALDAEFLSNTEAAFNADFTEHTVVGIDTTTSLTTSAPILEEGTVVFTGTQLIRNLHIANLDKIQPPGISLPREMGVTIGADKNPYPFQGDIKLEEGFNCRILTDQNTSTITIVPLSGSGAGEPCTENDPGSGEDGCSDFIYSINGLDSNEGAVRFKGVPPLQIFQGDSAFTSEAVGDNNADYIRGDNFPTTLPEGDFWAHALVFRIGAWGPNDDATCDGKPECLE